MEIHSENIKSVRITQTPFTGDFNKISILKSTLKIWAHVRLLIKRNTSNHAMDWVLAISDNPTIDIRGYEFSLADSYNI